MKEGLPALSKMNSNTIEKALISKDTYPQYFPLGDQVVIVQYEKKVSIELSQNLLSFAELIKDADIQGVTQIIPTFCSIAIRYNPLKLSYDEILSELQKLNVNIKTEKETITKTDKIVHIPVFYGEEYGPDLEYVSEKTGLTTSELIRLHSSNLYYIYMLGVIGSFPYCGDLDKKLSLKRRSSPRIKIEKGSIVIANEQTIIVSLESPSGWHIIGRTPFDTFKPEQNPPSPFVAGDFIKFEPISKEVMENWDENMQSEWTKRWNS